MLLFIYFYLHFVNIYFDKGTIMTENEKKYPATSSLLSMGSLPQPGMQLLAHVRAAFILKDTSLSQWCKDNKVSFSSARQAIIGGWDGVKGQQVRNQVLKDCGLVE